ncbi:tripartite tricarboxylate transporter substrate binding protein [Comamonas thiooxydans]|uniref:Bug family tripartite tricarboxylate transporter substrate binding protein n=1 Tax=Comamonas thiooxydans TaxID=363952 RepID=UPI00244C4226|nr:tripartite tricarboxylate transporter substrate binding protein [Comamonas thiooxydans]MDH1254275.1 tripartite tricarboxylate transporter substrate binding protein [Comamonas thiooxydans]
MVPFFRATTCRVRTLLALALISTPLLAQTVNYPTALVRTVMPYSAGSGPDSVMRHVGELLSKDWGQAVVVDNKPGANGWLAIGEVKRLKPDGQTLLALDSSYMALQPHLYKKLPFDPVKDFEPVAGLYHTGFFIVVKANSPWKSVADLIAAAKTKPAGVSYGTWGLGSVGHVGTAQFEAASGIQMMHVPFKELPQLYTSVANGEVDWAFGSAATVGPLYRAGKVKLLAYANAKRLPGYEEIPTVAEAGGPANLDVGTWVAIFAPKGTSSAVIELIRAGVSKTLTQPAVRERMATFGFQPWSAGPADLAQAMAADTQRFAQVVKSAKISLDK